LGGAETFAYTILLPHFSGVVPFPAMSLVIWGDTSKETSLFTFPVLPKSPTSLIFAVVDFVF